MANADLAIASLSGECLPEQFLRELYKNSEEAITRSGIGDTIQIRADEHYTAKLGVPKFSQADNGPGMSMDELEEKLKLFANASGQTKNRGVGAKISALARSHRNPFGVEIRTWQNGVGTIGRLSYSPARYTVAQMTKQEEALKPALIKGHGTVVVILGHSDKDNTMESPEGSGTRVGPRWIQQHLQSKFWVFPKDFSLKVHAFEGDTNRMLKGLSMYLEPFSEQSGDLDLPKSDFTAHWYILPEHDKNESRKKRKGVLKYDQFRNFTEVHGQTCVLFNNEIYDVQTAKSALHRFGVWTGTGRVVIVLEPKNSEKYEANTSRSALYKVVSSGMRPIPFDEIGSEFRSRMPAKLTAYMTESRGKSNESSAKYFDKTLYEVHGVEFYLSAKGKHLLPAEPGPINGAPRGTGGGGNGGGGGSTPGTPLPVLTGVVPSEDKSKRKKRFATRKGLPKITPNWVSKEEFDAPYYFAEIATPLALVGNKLKKSEEYLVNFNSDWHEIEALKRIIAKRTRMGDSNDAVVQDQIHKKIQDHLQRQVSDVILTAFESLDQGASNPEIFQKLTAPEALTSAAMGRWGLISNLSHSMVALNKAVPAEEEDATN
jgi:hypothetical protein